MEHVAAALTAIIIFLTENIEKCYNVAEVDKKQNHPILMAASPEYSGLSAVAVLHKGGGLRRMPGL